MHLKRWRVLGLALIALALIVVAALSGGGWYYSGVLKDGALEPDWDTPVLDLEVIAVREGEVTLGVGTLSEEDGPWTKDGIWGLELERGYHQVGAILSINEREVVREFLPLNGDPDLGEMARLDSFSFLGDPREAHGLPFEEVVFSSPLGDFAAWFVDGPRNTWAIFVHGKDSERQEALRMLPTMAGLGLPSLVITYRNDREAPASPDGFHRFGRTEWEDLEAAARYGLDHGAKDFILVGYSMGGAIVINFLYQSSVAGHVKGAILDAPMLDFNATIDLGARQRGAPGILTALGKFIAGARFDIDWEALDYLSRAGDLDVPILLFHGDDDETVPVESSDALAEARPDIVTYVRVPDATHVRSWNMNPVAYEGAVRDFLQGLTP